MIMNAHKIYHKNRPCSKNCYTNTNGYGYYRMNDGILEVRDIWDKDSWHKVVIRFVGIDGYIWLKNACMNRDRKTKLERLIDDGND